MGLHLGNYKLLVRVLIVLIIIGCVTAALGMYSRLFEDKEVEKVTSRLLNDMNHVFLTNRK